MLRPGDEPIPGYRLEKFLGKGQFGQVWRSSSPGKAAIALKFLDLSGKPGWREFRSIQQVKQIRHAHLMPITALWLLDDDGDILGDEALESLTPTEHSANETMVPRDTVEVDQSPRWLVIGQILGDNTLLDKLEEYQAQGEAGIPAPELLRYMEEAAKGIDFLNSRKHDLGDGFVAVQHCDIKPANILLVGDSVLICDFGVTRVLAESDTSATATGMVGSPAYMAPECIERKPSSASDQYSLAISYVELRTGKLPFKSQSYVDVLDAHRSGKLALEHLSADERAVIRKATSVSPTDRFESTVEMVRAMRRAVEGSQPEPRSNRVFQWAVLATCIVAIGALIWFWRGGGDGEERTVLIQVLPSDAEVLIDNEVQQVTQGKVSLLADQAATLEILVRRPPEFQELKKSIRVSETSSQNPLVFSLDRDAQYYLGLSKKAMEDEDLDGAIDALTEAVTIDPSLATFPPPLFFQSQEDPTMGKIESFDVSEDERWMVAGGTGKTARAWDLNDEFGSKKKDLYQHKGGIKHVDIGNKTVATADEDFAHIAVHSLNSGDCLCKLNAGGNDLMQIGISTDDRWLVTATANDRGFAIKRYDLSASNVTNSMQERFQHDLAVSSIQFSRDNQFAFTAGWDGKIGRIPLSIATGDENSNRQEAAFANLDGGELSVMGTTNNSIVCGGVRTVDDGESHYRLVALALDGSSKEFPTGHKEPIEVLCVSPDRKLIASASDQGWVQLWKLDDSGFPSEQIVLTRAHHSRVACLAFDSSSSWLISSGDDGNLILWDLEHPQRSFVTIGKHQQTVIGVRILSDGRIASASEDGTVQMRDLEQCILMKRACDNANIDPKSLHALPGTSTET